MYRLIDANDDFILIDKFPGFAVHKDQQETGLVMQLQQDFDNPNLSPVHRLDKVTSGLMLLACHVQAASELSAAFRERQISKYYLALSDKKPRKKQGLISGDMLKARRGAWMLAKSQQNPARTQFFSTSTRPGERLFLLKPLTGKTHQLRVALKSISAPILGDSLYHEKVERVPDRTYLHAYGLAFNYQGQTFDYLCPPTIGERFTDEKVQVIIQTEYGQPDQLSWPAANR